MTQDSQRRLKNDYPPLPNKKNVLTNLEFNEFHNKIDSRFKLGGGRGEDDQQKQIKQKIRQREMMLKQQIRKIKDGEKYKNIGNMGDNEHKKRKKIEKSGNYILDKLYPQYSPTYRQSRIKSIDNSPCTEHDRKIQKKMLMVLYQLDRNIQQEKLMNRKKNKGSSYTDSSKRAVSQSTHQTKSNRNIPHYHYKGNKKQKNHGTDQDSMESDELSTIRRIVTETRAARRNEDSQDDQDEGSIIKKYSKDKDRKKFKNRIRSMSQKNYVMHQQKQNDREGFLPKLIKNALLDKNQEIKQQNYKKKNKKKQFEPSIHLTKTLEKKLLLQQLQKSTKQDNKLGRLVLEKVQKHFDMQKRHNNHLYTEGYSHMTTNCHQNGADDSYNHQNKAHYFERVKSEQDIDDTLIKYLKNRVKQADLMISHKTQNVKEHLKGKSRSKNKIKSHRTSSNLSKIKQQDQRQQNNKEKIIMKQPKQQILQEKAQNVQIKQRKNKQTNKKMGNIGEKLYQSQFDKQFKQKVQQQMKIIQNSKVKAQSSQKNNQRQKK